MDLKDIKLVKINKLDIKNKSFCKIIKIVYKYILIRGDIYENRYAEYFDTLAREFINYNSHSNNVGTYLNKIIYYPNKIRYCLNEITYYFDNINTYKNCNKRRNSLSNIFCNDNKNRKSYANKIFASIYRR